MVYIDREAPGDLGAREALLDRAMGPCRRLKPSERLRAGRRPAAGMALVARDGNRLVGSVRLWDVAAGGQPLLLLGPLAVEPTLQGTGIGAALMRIAVARAAAAGHRAVVLVGDPEYYGRFGFAAEATGDLAMPAPVERRRFLGLELVERGLVGARGILTPAGVPAREALLLAA
jgi:predicted N-acetyltransferase YhbS